MQILIPAAVLLVSSLTREYKENYPLAIMAHQIEKSADPVLSRHDPRLTPDENACSWGISAAS
jgi:hypothetical protein